MSIRNGYHYNDERKEYYFDELGNKIPEQVCLCFAYEPSECCCDCTSWGNYSDSDYGLDSYW